MNLDEYRRMYQAEEAHWWYSGMREISSVLLDTLEKPVAERPPGKILDAGCGTGNNLLHLAEKGRAFGLDLSEEALGFCRERGVTVVRAGVGALPFADHSFDGVTSFDVLYHRWVENDQAAVAEMARVLRPGGFALVRLPALEILRRAHDDAVHTRHRYTRKELRRLLMEAGLIVLRATYCNTLLLPLVASRSVLDSLFGSQASDLSPLPVPLEKLFRGCLGWEARLIRRVNLPVGASVVALARKPAPNDPLPARTG